MEKKIFLLDAYALIFRAYYAFIRSPRIDSKGRNTSAIFGFVLMLEDILEKERPDLIGVVFDPPGGTFRHKEYEAYKAQREETPEAIRLSVPYIKRIIEAYKIPIVEVENYEADDVIGTLAKQAEAQGYTVMMVTPDKDYGQLVTDKSLMYRPKSSGGGYEIWGPSEVCGKFGLSSTNQIIDYLGLVGDASDNIPGCKGIGPKTAEKLLAEYKSIDGIYEHIDDIKGATRKKLLENKDETYTSRYLAEICTTVPIEFDEQPFLKESPDKDAILEIFRDLEFKSLLPRVLKEFAVSSSNDKPFITDLFADNPTDVFKNDNLTELSSADSNYHLLDSQSKIDEFYALLNKQQKIAFDTETTNLDPLKAELVAMTFSWKSGEAYFLPIPPERENALALLLPMSKVFKSDKILKIGQNLKYDIQVLANYDFAVEGPLFDTMVAHYLLNPDARHNMDEMAEVYLDYRTIHFSELVGSTAKKNYDLRALPIRKLCDYAAEDADITYRLYETFVPLLREQGLEELMQNIEMPLVPVLASMEREGVKLDTEVLGHKAQDMNAKLLRLENEIHRLAGQSFNINSSQQVGAVLFDKLKIADKPKKTKTGGYSTSEEVLEKLRDKHPIIDRILEYRGLKKLLSTYIESLPELIYPDGKLHSSFNQTVASTGRLSSSNPNLQNIPIRTEEGRMIREAFVPDSDECVFLSADYSQIELRLMAHLSGDKSLIQAFNAGEDIHRATAAKIYGVDSLLVTDDMRRNAKTANFGIIYGISAFGLSERLNIPRSESKMLIEGYFASYPGVKEYMDKSIEDAKETGYVTTLLGRKRYLKDINSANAVVRGYAERNAINAPIQGTAADIIKLAMIRIYNTIKERGLKSRMILQVHDELNFNVYRDELDEMKQIVLDGMQGVLPHLKVPLIAEMGVGANWLEAH
ncbi:DNA polymerase I [Porphyromonas pogonae]|uniref:DNA polymerase I n=1 Tax=Porphyromonas pogonae TaxID=867595 RepID=UPI002E7A631F|nr:DNA polymerase I [Porphyromonas pogonae]